MISADRRGDRLILSVLDHGSGVASEDLTRMFEPGWRAEPSRSSGTDRAAGAGLGLAIVQGIVHAHGGDVHAERTPAGFRLNVELPAAGVRSP